MPVSFWKVAQRYSTIFFDSYGVLKNSQGPLEGVPEMLQRLNTSGRRFFVITNDASRPPEEMAAAYNRLAGHELVAGWRIVTSGTLCSEFLREKVRSGEVAYLGKPTSAYYITQAGLTAVPLAEARDHHDLKALVLLDDEGFDWFADLNRAINLVRHKNLPVVVGNTDLTYPVSTQNVAVAVGGLARMMENILGTHFICFGKPDAMMFTHTFGMAVSENPTLRRRDVLMVGDTLHTDILGANKFGIDTMLVLSGNTQPERADVMIRSSGIVPTYVCDSILT
jgi:HAD superfamily hydrolase (TIGR01450 family)